MRTGDQVSFQRWGECVAGYVVAAIPVGTAWRTAARTLRRLAYLHEVPAFVFPEAGVASIDGRRLPMSMVDDLIVVVSSTPSGRTCLITLTEAEITGWVDRDSPDFLREWRR